MSEVYTGQRHWTTDEERLLRSLAAEGASVREMLRLATEDARRAAREARA